jgi:hypothetical protein
MKKLFIASFIIVLGLVFHLTSRPQYSIIQSFGTNCSACHFNVQGGGSRIASGWASRNTISLLPADWMSEIFTANSWMDDKITFGLDARPQLAKWPAAGQGTEVPVGTTEYNFMLMQLTPYLIISPFSWLSFEGQYNVSYNLYTDKRYVGQHPFAASAIFKVSSDLPQLRVGYFQPTMENKWDDHTLLSHQFYGKSRSVVVPDDYAELGAQLDYEGIPWLSASLGAFTSNNLAQYSVKTYLDESMRSKPVDDSEFKSIKLVDSNSISIVGRAFVSPNLGAGLTSYIGGTMFYNNDYYISNLFLGIGISDKFAFLAEFTDANKKDSRRAITYLGEFTYNLTESFLPYLRFERQLTREVTEKNPYYTNQVVLGAHVYVLPYVDLLPEWRIVDKEHIEGYHSSFAVQLHLWY